MNIDWLMEINVSIPANQNGAFIKRAEKKRQISNFCSKFAKGVHFDRLCFRAGTPALLSRKHIRSFLMERTATSHLERTTSILISRLAKKTSTSTQRNSIVIRSCSSRNSTHGETLTTKMDT